MKHSLWLTKLAVALPLATPTVESEPAISSGVYGHGGHLDSKSLLLDTLGCLFESRDALFEDLHIHDKWDWQTAYPVIRLSFGSGAVNICSKYINGACLESSRGATMCEPL